MKFDVSDQLRDDLKEEVNLDVDVVRCNIFPLKKPTEYKCTLEEELQPVSYRKDVQELLRLREKGVKKKWSTQMGIEYYPFQR